MNRMGRKKLSEATWAERETVDNLVKTTYPKLNKLIPTNVFKEISYEDKYDLAVDSLLTAALEYDPERTGNRSGGFLHFFSVVMFHRIAQESISRNRPINTFIAEDIREHYRTTSTDALEKYEQEVSFDLLFSTFHKKLTPRQKKIVELLFEDGGITESGNRLGVTRQSICEQRVRLGRILQSVYRRVERRAINPKYTQKV